MYLAFVHCRNFLEDDGDKQKVNADRLLFCRYVEWTSIHVPLTTHLECE